MSATPPQSPLKPLSTVDYLDSNAQTSKDEDNLLSEADENLHIGEDPLADRLDYEADELQEQEEISNIGKSSPLNEKEHSFHDFDTYDPDDKEEFDISHESFGNNVSETSTKSISDVNVTENVNINDNCNLFHIESSEASNKNEGELAKKFFTVQKDFD